MAAQSALTTVDEYLSGESLSKIRHEFVAGSVYAMSGASRNHVLITRSLSGILYLWTKGKKCINLDQDTKVYVAETHSYYYPDATVSCPPNFVDAQHGVIDNPTIIFEVLSPSTANLDRGAKFAAYRSLPSLRDFVLIESESASVEVYSLEGETWVVRFFVGQDATAVVPSLGIELPLSEMYQYTEFGPSKPQGL